VIQFDLEKLFPRHLKNYKVCKRISSTAKYIFVKLEICGVLPKYLLILDDTC
jgi:hypothetical protein